MLPSSWVPFWTNAPRQKQEKAAASQGKYEDTPHVQHVVFYFFCCLCNSRSVHPMLLQPSWDASWTKQRFHPCFLALKRVRSQRPINHIIYTAPLGRCSRTQMFVAKKERAPRLDSTKTFFGSRTNHMTRFYYKDWGTHYSVLSIEY